MDLVKGILNNITLWIAILSWAIASLLKVIIEMIKHRRIDFTRFLSTGGMPSSHSAFVSAMTTSIGLHEGFHTSLFAVSAIISMVVMSDAAGIRRAAGKQAAVINMIVESFENTGVKMDKKLKEMLGHTPVEVAAGALLGIIVACFFIK